MADSLVQTVQYSGFGIGAFGPLLLLVALLYLLFFRRSFLEQLAVQLGVTRRWLTGVLIIVLSLITAIFIGFQMFLYQFTRAASGH